MVSEGILDQVLYFKVTNFIPPLSDAHCKLEWTMSAKFVSQQKTDNTFVQPISPNFIWSEESSEQFRFALCSTEIQSKLKNFISNTIEGTEISVDGAAAELSEILFSATKSSVNR